MKLYKKILIIFFLVVIFIYTCNITLLPNNLILIQGEMLNLKTAYGITLGEDADSEGILQASSNINKNKVSNIGKLDVKLNLFGKFKVKDMTVNVIPNTKVIPVGKAIGMKLYTDGVLVVGMSEINGKKPYENTGIQEGDRIIEINNEKVDSTDELIETVNKSNGKQIAVKYKRNEDIITTSIEPAKTDDDQYKLGLWVRDAAAGVGTMTFYEPSSGMFAALGHGITDIDTSDLIQIANGELVTTNILSIVKGEKGAPGEIRGTIENGVSFGNIYKNTKYGVYGNVLNKSRLELNSAEEMEVALRNEIKTGKAQILCELQDGKIERYEIEIQKLFINNNEDNKSMVIKVTDKKLIEKTGGIIQGMSGAPIIQNGKFVGAVTHVLVNDPTIGYGVFADIMIKQLKEVN